MPKQIESNELVLKKPIQWSPWLFLLPAMLVFVVYVIYPIFQSVWLSSMNGMVWVRKHG